MVPVFDILPIIPSLLIPLSSPAEMVPEFSSELIAPMLYNELDFTEDMTPVFVRLVIVAEVLLKIPT